MPRSVVRRIDCVCLFSGVVSSDVASSISSAVPVVVHFGYLLIQKLADRSIMISTPIPVAMMKGGLFRLHSLTRLLRILLRKTRTAVASSRISRNFTARDSTSVNRKFSPDATTPRPDTGLPPEAPSVSLVS